MADHVLMVGWNRSVPGHEKAAMESFQALMAFCAKAAGGGHLASFEPIILARHGGDLNGFMLMRGEQGKLNGLVHSDEFKELILRAEMHVQGLGVIEGWTAAAAQKEIGRYMKIIS